MESHEDIRSNFAWRVMRLLTQEFVRSYWGYESSNHYSLNYFIGISTVWRTERVNRRIMKLCIKASDPLDRIWDGSTPIAVLIKLKQLNTSFAPIPRFKPYLIKFDGK